jgi:hypothetical protein
MRVGGGRDATRVAAGTRVGGGRDATRAGGVAPGGPSAAQWGASTRSIRPNSAA